MPTYHDIQQFLFREARLMDEHQYDDWLGLWAEVAHYWIPCSDDGRGIDQAISLVNEDRSGLEDRIKRLKSGAHYAQDPRSQLSRVVSNVEVVRDDANAYVIGSTFNLTACRRGETEVIAGRVTHTLTPIGAEFRMAAKKVVLANRDAVIANLTFLV
jgi:3-phenylpropionate/cinnamic acid dioxygenase small subunit